MQASDQRYPSVGDMSCSRGRIPASALALLLLLVATSVLPPPAEAGFFFGRRQQSPALSWWPQRSRVAPAATATTTGAPPASDQPGSKAMLNSMPSFKSCPYGQQRGHDGKCRRQIFG
ncbi:uncharacterized protein LOC126355083 isoform X3 [Schistocerca gregaria]|uniref:uncharacterized protein LOC126355083 isoform X3 n=2 Tax=Schistocerca gregaria TaxID=7010 RepID=UPI00211E884F|nr:uncharacterized protein LOC126355083 isoform X3 [Schistocerca gregaria]